MAKQRFYSEVSMICILRTDWVR